jgi:pimeloyl-ACP methyl ester carboxylesterase
MTLVLVHGSGDTSYVWKRVREHLRTPSIAVDLLGRGGRPYDLTRVTARDAARAAASDVRAAGRGPWILVTHSAGTIVAPHLVARLGDVRHLVMIAGVTAAEGEQAIDIVQPGRRAHFDERRGPLLEQYRRHTYLSRHDDERVARSEGLVALRDPRVTQSLDSFAFLFEPVSWAGVPPDLPRTWVRCLRDPLQNREVQDQLIAASGASRVLEIDTGHTPARDDPAGLAAMLDEIAAASLA